MKYLLLAACALFCSCWESTAPECCQTSCTPSTLQDSTAYYLSYSVIAKDTLVPNTLFSQDDFVPHIVIPHTSADTTRYSWRDDEIASIVQYNDVYDTLLLITPSSWRATALFYGTDSIYKTIKTIEYRDSPYQSDTVSIEYYIAGKKEKTFFYSSIETAHYTYDSHNREIKKITVKQNKVLSTIETTYTDSIAQEARTEISYDAFGILNSINEYNDNGRVTLYENYINGVLESAERKAYVGWNVISQIHYDGQYIMKDSMVATFEDSRLMIQSKYDNQHIMIDSTFYTYQENAIAEKKVFKKGNQLYEWEITEYYNSADRIKSVYKELNSDSIVTHIETYDSEGAITEATNYNNSGTITFHKKYFPNNTLSLSQTYSSGIVTTEHYYHDTSQYADIPMDSIATHFRSNHSKSNYYYASGTLERVIQYDQQGVLLTSTYYLEDGIVREIIAH